MVVKFFFIFLGGGIGSIVRYLTGRGVNLFVFSLLPYGTLAANLFSSVIMGAVAGFALHKTVVSDDMKFLLITGFCGGFSTFSTFSFETFQLFQAGHYVYALCYVMASVLICLLGIWGGIALGRGI